MAKNKNNANRTVSVQLSPLQMRIVRRLAADKNLPVTRVIRDLIRKSPELKSKILSTPEYKFIKISDVRKADRAELAEDLGLSPVSSSDIPETT